MFVEFSVPNFLQRQNIPRGQSQFKIKDEVSKDEVFKAEVKLVMNNWKEIQAKGLGILKWWEYVVKPGLRRLAISRQKEINNEKKGGF